MAYPQPSAALTKTPAGTSLWLLACGFNAAVGTCVVGARYYVLPGFSWVDVLLVLAAVRVALSGRRAVLPTSRVMSWHVLATLALSFWLILSTAVNSFRFQTQVDDILPALKLVYLAICVVMIRRYTFMHGVRWLLIGCVAGVLFVAVQDLVLSERTVVGLPLLLNPNVTGALLGLGVWFAAFWLIFTRTFVTALMAALMFAALSVTSFSKGAWLMCGFGLMIALVVVLSRRKIRLKPKYRFISAIVVLAALLQSAVVIRDNIDRLSALLSLKVESTIEGGSVNIRADFVKASVRAGFANPIFGLGYRNFYQMQWMYPDLRLPPLERLDNAHNLFAQTLAVGGIPAFLLLGSVFMLPFATLRQKLTWRLTSAPAQAAVWALSLGVWFLYGSVQLQLTAQPIFWMFCGMVFGLQRETFSPASTR